MRDLRRRPAATTPAAGDPAATSAAATVTSAAGNPVVGPAPPGRDPALDALRALAILGVVLGHWLVTALVPDSGTLRVESPLRHLPVLTPVSWLFQTLAVFFLVGGYVAARGRAAARSREPGAGRTHGRWVAVRLGRFFRPVAPLAAVWLVASAAMLACGVPWRTVHTLGRLVLSPLWFLLVLSVLTAATPLVARVHPLWPLAVVVHVDLVRFGFDGPDALGWINLPAGWLVPYCLGALLARRGPLAPTAARALLLGGAAATGLLVAYAGYPASMVGVPGAPVSNLDPPTLAAVTFGLAQCGAALLLLGPLRAALRWPAPRAAVALLNRGAMTVFLWHQTAMIAVTAVGLVAVDRLGRAPLAGLHTVPDGAAWVLARCGWLPLFAGALLVCAAAFHGHERAAVRRMAPRTAPAPPGGPTTGRRPGVIRGTRPRLGQEDDHTGGGSTVADTARGARPPRAVPDVLRAAPRVLRADLRPGRRDPLPPHRLAGRLAHGHIVLFSVLMGLWDANHYERFMEPATASVNLLVVLQGAAPVLALSRPAAALWLSTASLAVTAVLTSGVPGLARPWSVPGIALHALVLLLLALRVRPTASAAAVVLSVLTGAGAFVPRGVPGLSTAAQGAVVFAFAVVLGCSLRAVRVSRSRLVEQEEITAEERSRRALLEERGRIARELHDVVAHHMSVISIQAQVAPHLVTDPSPELRENLAGIRQNAVDALTELRRVLGVLRGDGDPGDPGGGVRHAPQPTLGQLDDLLANVRSAGLDVARETRGTPRPLSPGTELSAYRIVQEALSNVMRHAPGARATVSTHYHPAGLTVRVTNTAAARPAGGPAPHGAAREPGHGLLGMRERTAMLGGELAAGPAPGGGWEITATLPAPGHGPLPPTPKDGS